MPDPNGNYTIYLGKDSITFAEHEAPAFIPYMYGELLALRSEVEALKGALAAIQHVASHAQSLNPVIGTEHVIYTDHIALVNINLRALKALGIKTEEKS
jgi:hypothetical protein